MLIQRCPHCMADLREYEEGPCPFCGFDQDAAPQPEGAMPRNTILHGKYLVGDVLGQGGFGITYIGFDLSLESKVAIKEYCPTGAATRRKGQNSLLWNSSHLSQAFRQSAYEDFLKEARKMAKIDQISSIVRVRETFLENETAYIVMDYVEGETLKQRLKKNGVMKFSDCITLLRPMMEDLDKVHAQGLIHRDISPDNIMIQPDGKVKLLDLGAAKDMTLQRDGVSQLVTKKGFSPAEQYMDSGKIGPWTDVYALCATIYYACYGRMVPPSLERLAQDNLTFDLAAKEPIPPAAVETLKQGLAVRVEDRTQSVGQLLAHLEGSRPIISRLLRPLASGRKKPLLPAILGGAAAALLLIVLAVFFSGGQGEITVQTLGCENGNLSNIGGYQKNDDYQYFIGADNALYICAWNQENETFYVDQLQTAAYFCYFINLSEDSVYFCSNDYEGCSIQRMDLDGSDMEELVSADLRFVFMQYVQMSNGREYLYYIVRSQDDPYQNCGSLYRYDLKKKTSELLVEGQLIWFNFYQDSLYTLRYNDRQNGTILEKRTLTGADPLMMDDQSLCSTGFIEEGKLFLRSFGKETVLVYDLNEEITEGTVPQGLYQMSVDLTSGLTYGDGWLYYVNSTDSSVHRIRPDGTGDQLVLEGRHPSTIGYLDSWFWFIETTSQENASYDTMQAYLSFRDGSNVMEIAGPDLAWSCEIPMLQEFSYELNEAGDGYILTGYQGSATSLALPWEIDGLPVVEIGPEAFKGSSIQEVQILRNVTAIDDSAFFGCKDLVSVRLPDGLLTIGGSAFGDCNSLTQARLPDSVTSVGSLAFAETRLSSVYIPASLTDIGSGAFALKDDAGLTAFEVSSDNPKYQSVDGILYQNNRSTLVACPVGWEGKVTVDSNTFQIGAYSFAHCSKVTEVDMPIYIFWVNSQAFFGCYSLESIQVSPVCEVADNLGRDELVVERYQLSQEQTDLLVALRDRLISG